MCCRQSTPDICTHKTDSLHVFLYNLRGQCQVTADRYYLIILVTLLLTGIALSWKRTAPCSNDIPFSSQAMPITALFSYPAIMLLLGFLPATSIFLFWLARHNKKSWSYSFAFCFIVPTLIYGIVYFVIGKPLPLGLVLQLMAM